MMKFSALLFCQVVQHCN